MDDLKHFISVSKYLGQRFDIVQGGGGNTSVSLPDDTLLIKSSGVHLSEISEEFGWVKVNKNKILEILQDKELRSLKKTNARDTKIAKLVRASVMCGGNKPSIEVFMHALLNKYTLHTHPLMVNCLVTQADWEAPLSKLFPEALLIKYNTPGFDLALSLLDCLSNTHSNPEIIFLQNHGLIVSSKDPLKALDITEEVLTKIGKFLGIDGNEYRTTSIASNLINQVNTLPQAITYLSKDRTLYEILRNNRKLFFKTPCFPDMLVYCGFKILELDNELDYQKIKHYKDQYNSPPKVIIIKDRIYFIADNVRKAKEAEEVCRLHLLTLSISPGESNPLPKEELFRLNNWEAEKYRQSI